MASSGTGSDRGVRIRTAIASLAIMAQASVAWSQPTVRVKAGTRLELHAVRNERGVALEGVLLDDLDAALEGRRVELRVASEAPEPEVKLYSTRTRADGSFALQLSAPRARFHVRADYDGDVHAIASERELQVDLSQEDLRIRFVVPREQRIELDVPEHEVAVLLTSKATGAGLEIALENENGQTLARGRSADDGTFHVRLRSSSLGPPAFGRLVARSPGDARRSAASSEIVVLRFRRTFLSLRAARDPATGSVRVSGTLRTADAGLANKAIGLFAGGDHLASVLTNAEGRFDYQLVPATTLRARARKLALEAHFSSDAEWLGSSRATSSALSLEPPEPRSSLWMLLPIAISAGLFYLLWRGEPRVVRAEPPPSSARRAGIHAAPIAKRGASDKSWVEGRVCDAMTDRPLVGARVELVQSRVAAVVLATTDAGRFRSPALDAGVWTIRISAPGFRALSGTIPIPHRGEWLDMIIQLANLRGEAVTVYKPAALRTMSSPEHWESWTLRETLAHARAAGRATESFVQLTERVELVAYASDVPNESEVSAIELAARATTQLPD